MENNVVVEIDHITSFVKNGELRMPDADSFNSLKRQEKTKETVLTSRKHETKNEPHAVNFNFSSPLFLFISFLYFSKNRSSSECHLPRATHACET